MTRKPTVNVKLSFSGASCKQSMQVQTFQNDPLFSMFERKCSNVLCTNFPFNVFIILCSLLLTPLRSNLSQIKFRNDLSTTFLIYIIITYAPFCCSEIFYAICSKVKCSFQLYFVSLVVVCYFLQTFP